MISFFMINNIKPYPIVVPKILFIKIVPLKKESQQKNVFVKLTPIIK